MNQEQMTEGRAEVSNELESDVVELAEKARDAIEQFVQEQPHAALGIAAAAGFVLGGGLTPRRLIRLGLAAGGPALSRQLVGQVVRMATDALEAETQSPRRASPRKHRAKAEGRGE
jgi:hypothetical protein